MLAVLFLGLVFGGYTWFASGDDSAPPSEGVVPAETDPGSMVGTAPPALEAPKARERDYLELVEAEPIAGSSAPGLAEPADAKPTRGPEETLGAQEMDRLATVVDATSAAITAAAEEHLPLALADPDPSDGPKAQVLGPAPAIAEAAFKAGKIVVASPAVQRFSLARGVENREPVSDLNGVRFDANGLATVYAFSEVAGLAGSTLYYHWVHDAKERAAVPVRVGAERWRSYSSKYIEESMTGSWSVQLRDAEGKLLAEAAFSLPRQ